MLENLETVATIIVGLKTFRKTINVSMPQMLAKLVMGKYRHFVFIT